ncbi:glycine oxidase ThiO [Aurantivibrio plasticivorans]
MTHVSIDSTIPTDLAFSKPIAIIGAGLLGRLLAWQLLESGHNVTLFDRDRFTTSSSQPRAAAFTAAAMISPLSEVVVSERSIYDAGMKSLLLWPRWIESLNHTTQNPIAYHATGSLVVAHPADINELQQFKRDLGFHLGEDDHSQWLDHQAIEQCEPQLKHFQQGLLLPDEAFLDNHHLLDALLERIQSLGGECIENCAIEVSGPNNTPPFQATNFSVIIDCRGTGARTHTTDSQSIRGVRGEVMWVETDEISLTHAVRLCHPRYKLYVVPKPNHQFIIGATEIESEDTSPISLQSTLELSSALYTIHPAFAEARVVKTDVNLRPAYRDNLPRVERKGNIISANGLYRHGYLLAPVIVQQVLKEIAEFANSKAA